jgi:hypothetical protein|tara:strand:+ start:901 stop:1917 length:1017 start_codon:yes stop_codon:yes gene_type:complete
MIKVKLCELDIHRNETTFRPLLMAQDIFREVGIEFTTSGDYDYVFVGQASIIDKKKPLRESIDKGLEFVSKITGDYFILDGQDATTLIGTIDVFRESNALLFLKNTYLKDFELYKQGWANGRYYWGEGEYSVSDIDELKPRMKLSGCNWLHTVQPNWLDYSQEKSYDVSCMFGYPTKEPVYEHDVCQTDYYDPHRKNLMDVLGDKYNVAKLIDGVRIPTEEYYQKMFNSKIIMAPLGYGEMAPRDLESAMFGNVLLKPDMSYISSEPFIYEDDETYIAVNYDWSNLEEKIDYVLSDYNNIRERLVQNMRKKYKEKYNLQNLVMHMYDMFENLQGVVNE